MEKIFTFKNKKHMPKWLAWLLAKFVRLYAWTFRISWEDPEGIFQGKHPAAMVCPMWHNRIIFQAIFAPLAFRKQCTTLISNSRDGGYIASVITDFGMQVVRGSSSKGALHAFLGLRRALQEGRHAILTVDGPRGPRYTVHSGATMLAMKSKSDLCPLSFEAKKCWRLHSWDGTIIPKPFSRIIVRVGHPFRPDSSLNVEEVNQKVQQMLMQLSGEVLS